jgi:hypothetical protein
MHSHTIPEPKIAANERSEEWLIAPTEFKKSSGAAEPKATNVTLISKYEKRNNQTQSKLKSYCCKLLG